MQNHKKHFFMLDLADDAILHSLLFFHFLRADQICRLHFSPGSLTWVRSRRLKRLVTNGYIQLAVGGDNKPIKPYVYALHTRGRRYLEDLGVDVPHRFNASEQIRKALRFLQHTLAINDVLIAASLLARDYEDISLATMHHEIDLKSEPLHVTYYDQLHGREQPISQSLIPDGWFDIYVGDKQKQTQWRFSIWLELDRGTIKSKKFKRKIRVIIEYLKTGDYQKRFSSDVALIAFVTPVGQARVAAICAWFEEEAAKTDDVWIKNLVFATTFANPAADPLTFFFSPVWYTPGNTKPVSLFHIQG